MSEIHKLLGIEDGIYQSLTEVVPSALVQSLSEPTPVAIKAATIKKVLDVVHDEWNRNTYALAGMMVEQAYNAAVLQSKKPPLFKKK